MYTKDFLKGTLKTMLLNLLDEKGDMYGYEITQTVKLRSNQEINLTEGALYPALHKLEANNWVNSYTQAYDGRLRKYYKLTSKGRAEAKKSLLAWKNFSGVIDHVLNPRKNALQ